MVESLVRCPDDGACHHYCTPGTECWRVRHAAPLSDVGKTWNDVARNKPLKAQQVA